MKGSLDISASTTQKWPQIVAAASAAGGAFAVGAALGWPAPAGPALINSTGGNFILTQSQFDWVASIITLGAAISCLPVGFLMKKFGRKTTMLGLVVPFMVGWLMVILAKNFPVMLAGRFIIGLAGGAFCVSAPQYSSEIAEKEIRGVVGTFFQVLIITGILFTYIVGAFVDVFALNVICATVPLIFGAIFCFMPESPVYLVIEKRDEDAIRSFKWLRGASYDPQGEIDALKAEMAESESQQVSLGEVMRRKSTKRALFIGLGLMTFQQCSGINVVIFFSTAIFEAAKTSIDANLSTIIVGVVHLVATVASSLLIDRAGRKILLLISVIVMTVTLIAFGVFFYLAEVDPMTAESINWLPLTSLCVYLVFFALGYGPVVWVMLSEIYSKEYNFIASPISGAFNWSLAFLITVTFGSISEAIGIGMTFWMFAALSALGTIFTFVFVPETKGKSINDIQRLLSGEKQASKQIQLN